MGLRREDGCDGDGRRVGDARGSWGRVGDCCRRGQAASVWVGMLVRRCAVMSRPGPLHGRAAGDGVGSTLA